MSDQGFKEGDPDHERLRKAVEGLSEHFDSVHIFATRHHDGGRDGTSTFQIGRGNWYARYGQVREWLLTMDAITHHNATNDAEGAPL